MKLFKPTYPKPVPAGAEIVARDGKPHVKLREGGRTVYWPLTKDCKDYLKDLDCWYVKVPLPGGKVRKVRLSPVRAAAEAMAGDLIRQRELGRAGAVDPFAAHARTPLDDHLQEWAADLRAKGDTEKHVRATTAAVARIFDACGFVHPPDRWPATAGSRSRSRRRRHYSG